MTKPVVVVLVLVLAAAAAVVAMEQQSGSPDRGMKPTKVPAPSVKVKPIVQLPPPIRRGAANVQMQFPPPRTDTVLGVAEQQDLTTSADKKQTPAPSLLRPIEIFPQQREPIHVPRSIYAPSSYANHDQMGNVKPKPPPKGVPLLALSSSASSPRASVLLEGGPTPPATIKLFKLVGNQARELWWMLDKHTRRAECVAASIRSLVLDRKAELLVRLAGKRPRTPSGKSVALAPAMHGLEREEFYAYIDSVFWAKDKDKSLSIAADLPLGLEIVAQILAQIEIFLAQINTIFEAMGDLAIRAPDDDPLAQDEERAMFAVAVTEGLWKYFGDPTGTPKVREALVSANIELASQLLVLSQPAYVQSHIYAEMTAALKQILDNGGRALTPRCDRRTKITINSPPETDINMKADTTTNLHDTLLQLGQRLYTLIPLTFKDFVGKVAEERGNRDITLSNVLCADRRLMRIAETMPLVKALMDRLGQDMQNMAMARAIAISGSQQGGGAQQFVYAFCAEKWHKPKMWRGSYVTRLFVVRRVLDDRPSRVLLAIERYEIECNTKLMAGLNEVVLLSRQPAIATFNIRERPSYPIPNPDFKAVLTLDNGDQRELKFGSDDMLRAFKDNISNVFKAAEALGNVWDTIGQVVPASKKKLINF